MSERPRRKESRKLIRQRHDSTLLIDWKKEFDPEAQPLSYTNARMCHDDRGNLLDDCAALEAEIKKLRAAATNLYDNRLGHRDDNPLWSAPQDFWRTLGDALDD
jgi:hypothetical protein